MMQKNDLVCTIDGYDRPKSHLRVYKQGTKKTPARLSISAVEGNEAESYKIVVGA